MENILIFILFLCPLIFFHELGHFLAARLFGVRVEVFSLGFGPKIFKYKRRDTQYAVSLIPLGGYVKMFGEDSLKKDEIAAEDRKYSFTHKGRWARFWIVFSGPLANFIFAYAIFVSLLSIGEKLPELRFGVVPTQTPFYEKGIRTGDVIREINDIKVLSLTDIALDETAQIETIAVERDEKLQILKLNLTLANFFDEFAKLSPLLRRPILLDRNGKRFVVSEHADRVNFEYSLDRMLDSAKSLYVLEAKDNGYRVIKRFSLTDENSHPLLGTLRRLGYCAKDLQIQSVSDDSPAERAGLLTGDTIISLQGKPVYSFDELRNNLQEIKEQTVEVGVWRKGKVVKVKLNPEEKEIEGKPARMIGVYSDGEYIGAKFISTQPKGLIEAMGLGFIKSWTIIVKTVVGFKNLLLGKISLKNVGGPIAIGKVANDSFKMSISYFFQIMAVISINLGFMNLLPVPVLDGGHILFIIFEVFNRGPLSRKKMELAQQFGLSLLLVLMFAVIFNDVSKLF